VLKIVIPEAEGRFPIRTEVPVSQNSVSSLLYEQNSAVADTLPLQEIEGIILVFLSFLALASSLRTLASSLPALAIRS